MSEMAIVVAFRGGVIANSFTDSLVGIVEPQSPQAVSLGVARTLTTLKNGQGVIRIVNPTSQPVSLRMGCPIGKFFFVLRGNCKMNMQ